MEMPKGWQILDQDIPEGHQHRRIDKALPLMQETAEVLEFYASKKNYELNWIKLDIKESIRTPRIGDAVKGEKAEAVLTKFKEWERNGK